MRCSSVYCLSQDREKWACLAGCFVLSQRDISCCHSNIFIATELHCIISCTSRSRCSITVTTTYYWAMTAICGKTCTRKTVQYSPQIREYYFYSYMDQFMQITCNIILERNFSCCRIMVKPLQIFREVCSINLTNYESCTMYRILE